jgi:hypothetical protein
MIELLLLKAGKNEGDESVQQAICAVMNGLSQVPRMNTLVLFLTQSERASVRALVNILGRESVDNIWQKF